jgi:diguanylate cyclase (GGDEF)-like protein
MLDKDFLNTLTILYVEDDADTRKSLTELFQNKVNKLYVAKDGDEALEIFKQHTIHFIISDYRMPNMNGTELCAKVKELNFHTCFVLLTAYNDTGLLIDAIDSGVDKFIQKPVDSEKLFNTMSAIEIKIMNKFKLEKSTICLQEAEHIALLSYWEVNINYKDILSIVSTEDKVKFIEIFEIRVFQDDKIDEIITINKTNDEKIYIHIIAKRWTSSACGGKHVVGMFQDVSHYELQKIKLIKESQLDTLLNIRNKKYILLELEYLIDSSRRYGHPIGVIFFDIDDFKAINDKYGHLIADDILIELSNLIKCDIRKSDLFGRWGGDEFVIITGHSSQHATIELAQKVTNKTIEHKWLYDISLTVSMGLSFYEDGDDINTLLHRADLKMLEAKKDGKNRYSY